jgi:hypothetical protein
MNEAKELLEKAKKELVGLGYPEEEQELILLGFKAGFSTGFEQGRHNKSEFGFVKYNKEEVQVEEKTKKCSNPNCFNWTQNKLCEDCEYIQQSLNT